jgi:hypothetical protein
MWGVKQSPSQSAKPLSPSAVPSDQEHAEVGHGPNHLPSSEPDLVTFFGGRWIVDFNPPDEVSVPPTQANGVSEYFDLNQDGTAVRHCTACGYERLQEYNQWTVSNGHGLELGRITLELPYPYFEEEHISVITVVNDDTFYGYDSLIGDFKFVFRRSKPGLGTH